MEGERNIPISDIIITFLAVLSIFGLSFLLYYFTVRITPTVIEERMPINKKTATVKEKAIVLPTNIIKFTTPEALPTTLKTGSCFASSLAEPNRQDAWRCTVQNIVYDPCFETGQEGFVFCQINPLKENSFLIKLTKALPKPLVAEVKKANQAWFIKLKDGTYCAPFTGTLPKLEDKIANYGCSGGTGKVLLGDLVKGKVWTGEIGFLVQSGKVWKVQSSQKVEIDTIWQ